MIALGAENGLGVVFLVEYTVILNFHTEVLKPQ
jgi:hypothetical protein